MTIKSGIADNNNLLASGDNTLLSPSADQRMTVTSGAFSETTGAAETIELFISPNATSASGKRFAKMVFSPDEDKSPVAIFNRAIGAGNFLVAKATNGNRVNADLTFTLYDGDDL